jgi:hypothetical protein
MSARGLHTLRESASLATALSARSRCLNANACFAEPYDRTLPRPRRANRPHLGEPGRADVKGSPSSRSIDSAQWRLSSLFNIPHSHRQNLLERSRFPQREEMVSSGSPPAKALASWSNPTRTFFIHLPTGRYRAFRANLHQRSSLASSLLSRARISTFCSKSLTCSSLMWS